MIKEMNNYFTMDTSSLLSLHSWKPVATVDTASMGYWFNWRAFVCATWILLSMTVGLTLIWKYEGSNAGGEGEGQKRIGAVQEDESWRPCLKDVHPAWLLAFRIFAFFVLSTLLTTYSVVYGGSTFYYYTQWTFALVTLYFALGSMLSMHGCHQYLQKFDGDMDMNIDEEGGTCISPSNEQETGSVDEDQMHQVAGSWGYIFQILYQTNAGAVMLTDIFFWLIIVPFLTKKDYDLNYLMIGMHTANAVFLFGDAALNSMRFPFFRISYFLLWTSIYIFFHWIVHACISIWWPYPFLDVSSRYAPVWYLFMATLHLPCYAAFSLLLKLKHSLLSSWFPHSYQLTK